VYLNGDREVNAIRFSHRRSNQETSQIYLNGTLSIGKGGFFINSGDHIDITDGTLTSHSGIINIHSEFRTDHAFDIRGPITNNGNIKVGLNITAGTNAVLGVELVGGHNNTFTGDTNLSGRTNINLIKNNGIIAISGNLNIRDGAAAQIFYNEQIANHVRVSLISKKGTQSTLRFHGKFQTALTETIHELVVEGNGTINFGVTDSDAQHGNRFLYLDDLIIESDSALTILGWKDKRDYLLVRKDSAHLEDALKKIAFTGYDRNNIHKEDFNRDYWAISAAPEPATYGLLLAAIAAALPLFRNRLRCTSILRMIHSFGRLGTKCVRYSYSKMVATLASVRRRMSSGTCSTKRATRSCKSTTLGWSQRMTPVVRVPSNVTAKSIRLANWPPVVIGRMTGTPVTRLKSSEEMISTGR